MVKAVGLNRSLGLWAHAENFNPPPDHLGYFGIANWPEAYRVADDAGKSR
ncbi:hypothetical protein [Nakamurella sp.]